MSKKPSFYDRFMAKTPAEKKDVKDHLLYQLYKKVAKEPRYLQPHIIQPMDHSPNDIQQCDLLVMSEDDGYKYALVVVDTGSRLTELEPLKTKTAAATLEAIKAIYKRGVIKMPSKMIQVDDGSEFKGVFAKFFTDKDVFVRVAQAGRSRQQGLVETRNGQIARVLIKRQVAEEALTGVESKEWVAYAPRVIKLMNEDYYMKKEKLTPEETMADVLLNKKHPEILPIGTPVRILLDKPEAFIDGKRLHGKFREGDIRWSREPTKIIGYQMIPNEPVLYKVEGYKPLFTFYQLQVISDNVVLPKISDVSDKLFVKNILEKRKVKNKVEMLVEYENSTKQDWVARADLVKSAPALVKAFEAKKK